MKYVFKFVLIEQKENPDGSLSNYPSLRNLKESGLINKLKLPCSLSEAGELFVVGEETLSYLAALAALMASISMGATLNRSPQMP